MILRDYQIDAVEKTLTALNQGKHPAICVATGGGKSIIIAELCRRLPGKILCATHTAEIVSQDYEEFSRLAPEEDAGIYSAGLGRRDKEVRVLFAGVQSIHRRMEELQSSGAYRWIIHDEAHTATPQGSDGKMYNAVFSACQQAQRIALSATPFRLTDGLIYGPSPCWYDTLVCDYGIKALTPTYLAPLRGVLTAADVPLAGVRVRAGDFVTSDLAQAASDEELVNRTLDEICFLAAKRKKWLLFAIDCDHTALITQRLKARDIDADFITGNTPKEERQAIIERFKNGQLRALVNCQVLTTGFNCPSLDMIAVLRPTQSRGLFVQMIGRATRKAEGKTDALLLDFGSNIERFSPITEIHDTHYSPARVAQDANRKRRAEEKRERDLKHGTRASTADPMGEEPQTITAAVEGMFFSVEESKNPRFKGKAMLKVLYKLSGDVKWCAQFLCIQHGGYATQQAQQWFTRRGAGMPPTAAIACAHGKARAYRVPESVAIRKEGSYYRVVMEHFGE